MVTFTDFKVNDTVIPFADDPKPVYAPTSAWNVENESDNYTVNNSYTVEQLTKMKETYNTISLWVAFESSIGSISFLNAGAYSNDTLSVNFRQKANVTSATIGVWTKWSVSIDDYISLIEAHGNSKLTLFGGKPATKGVFGIYFGDIFFEYVEN